MRISDQEIREIEDVLSRTTPGIWDLMADDRVAIKVGQDTTVAHVNRLVDADFIVAAHRAVPLMIQEIRTLRAALNAKQERSFINRIIDRLQFWKG